MFADDTTVTKAGERVDLLIQKFVDLIQKMTVNIEY